MVRFSVFPASHQLHHNRFVHSTFLMSLHQTLIYISSLAKQSFCTNTLRFGRILENTLPCVVISHGQLLFQQYFMLNPVRCRRQSKEGSCSLHNGSCTEHLRLLARFFQFQNSLHLSLGCTFRGHLHDPFSVFVGKAFPQLKREFIKQGQRL